MTHMQATPVQDDQASATDEIRRFFAALPARGTLPALRGADGVVKVEIEGAGAWRLRVDAGRVTLLETDGPADCAISAQAADFARLVRGETTALTAFARGDLSMTGDLHLIARFVRVFPPPAQQPAAAPVSAPADGQPAPHANAGDATAQDQEPPRQTVSILEGNTFVVSDRRGDIDATPTNTQGLFFEDTRFLSQWILTVNGARPLVLSTDDLQYFSVQFFLVLGTGTVYVDAQLSVIRQRAVGGGFYEEITFLNHTDTSVPLIIRIEAGADFADLFEIKDALPKHGRYYRRVEDGHLVLGYQRERFVRETWVKASAAEAQLDEHGITFQIELAPQGSWKTDLEVITALTMGNQVSQSVKYLRIDAQPRPDMQRGLDDWLAAAPRLVTDSDALARIYRRSLVDLAALRFPVPLWPGGTLPAAGLPWFMAVFGRDSLITSFQALPFTAELAQTTLRMLALSQGTHEDDFRDEEPGKILHEMRLGELTAFEERPHSPYFGTADATALFLIVLDEYERWTGDVALVRDLEPNARAALRWLDEYGDRNGDGYIEYNRRNTTTGLENQGWKDSWNSILFADGTLAKLPRATCELQGYAYDAKVRCARLAREIWNDPTLAERLDREAAELKRRFNHDFWMPERRVFRAGARWRRAQGGLARLQHGASALERHRRGRQGGGVRAAPAGRPAL